MDLEIKVQQLERDVGAAKALREELKGQQDRMAELLTSGQTQLDLKSQINMQLEGQASLQSEAIQALQSEINDAKMALAQTSAQLILSEEACLKLQSQLAESKASLEVHKQMSGSKMGQSSFGKGGAAAGVDPDIVSMKYELWKPKMTCGGCRENWNDVEVVLPCGHLLCQKCVDALNKNR